MTTVMLVDDHPIVLTAVRMLLERERFRVIGTAEDGKEAVELARKLSPQVVIVDIGLPELDGMEVIKRLQLLDPPPKIMALTGQPADLYVRRCLDAGIGAFVNKNEDIESVVFALKALIKGYSTFPQMSVNSNSLESENARLDSLSNREMEVLRRLARGENNKAIGESMNLSAKTISTYRGRIMEKLKSESLVEMIDLAKRNSVN
ncbi:two-component system response regulator EvgA [Pseudomonas sp. BIGb0278]|jgi:two-component system response regulator EvgA|uniref:Virulence factors putative positive transcription regulator BvgA n=1 Tax=Pseudomonas fluorescens TaxID=294 RepID=A0A5E6PZ45_PSEFL|nr:MULTISPECIES: response regulator transcription factor [Pseudomonas]MBA1321648.1 response regulator transcription factor [Pseudomonas plecoglossicida]MCS4283064.1 two-component system response regulator EvgA [Pseudomonas sp. BIGb0278]QYX53826.1 response regulator transcription factor [Pseudomonas sp. S07E 245]VVM48289.1 Virulence factors putative positive transcription regulator BvgA [Pseudomonas fluorescens]VVM51300.1 Virulence factors putative positive transcription regulator BvgA [Pseudom